MMIKENRWKFIYAMFLVIPLLLNFIFIDKAIAKQVQVCDMGVYKFYNRAYKVNEMFKTGKDFDKLEHIGEMSENSPYDNYCTGFGEYGHAALVTFYANKAGYVSKITIWGKKGDALAEKNIGISMGCILISLGLDKNEFDYVTDKLLSNGSSNVWAKKINRRIVLEVYSVSNQVTATRITAYDN